VLPDAYPDRRYGARVVKLYPQIDRQKGTLRVEVQIERPDAYLWPDMSVRITFLKPVDAPAVLVPRGAVRDAEGGAFVWTLADGVVRRVSVGTGADYGGLVPGTRGRTREGRGGPRGPPRPHARPPRAPRAGGCIAA